MTRTLLNFYKNNSLLTRLHVWVRLKTCPFSLIEEFIPRKGLIIDYGCGHGVFSNILSIASAKREVYGVDMSDEKIAEAKKTLKRESGVRFSTDCNVDGLIKNASGVAIVDVLYYLSHREHLEILKMFYDNLRPETTLVIKDQNKSFSIKYLLLYLQEFLAVKVFGITKAKGLHFFTKEYLSALLNDIGFAVKTADISRGYFYPHLVFICKKRQKI